MIAISELAQLSPAALFAVVVIYLIWKVSPGTNAWLRGHSHV